MKKEHQEIIDLISSYLEEYPSQRFGQAIFNLGINEFVNRDADSDIVIRIKSQLEWFDKQKKR